jgi:hypothetical protein
MAANLPAYDTLLEYCRQFLPEERITRLRNLVWLMLSLLHSTDGHLSSLAEVIALAATELSIEQRIRRWLKNSKIDVRAWYEPFIRSTLRTYTPGVIYVVMDSTQYGPSCRALVMGVAYGGQVLPLGWRVVKGKKGHTCPQLQKELLVEIRACLPAGPVVLVADSEFCAVAFLNTITDWGWHFIVRVRSNVYLHQGSKEPFTLASVALKPGELYCWRSVFWTTEHLFGPLLRLPSRRGYWAKGEDEPLYVLTDTQNEEAALLVYAWRFWIEPLFADFKGRGFHLAQTRIRDPKRLSRLLLVACITFLWTVSVGSQVFHSSEQRLVDRNDRTDRSFFQLGYRLLKRLLKLAEPLRVLFQLHPDWLPIALPFHRVT